MTSFPSCYCWAFLKGILTQIRPLWIDDLGISQKIEKVDVLGLTIAILCFLAVADIAKKI
jgi:hypothetical protein